MSWWGRVELENVSEWFIMLPDTLLPAWLCSLSTMLWASLFVTVFSVMTLGLTSGPETRELMEHEVKTLKMSARAPFKKFLWGCLSQGWKHKQKAGGLVSFSIKNSSHSERVPWALVQCERMCSTCKLSHSEKITSHCPVNYLMSKIKSQKEKQEWKTKQHTHTYSNISSAFF